jgi:hypothetical protein
VKYSGRVIQESQSNPKLITLRYEFAMPMRAQIYEEYIIMDVMNVVGVIGGTFGLFIGKKHALKKYDKLPLNTSCL